MPQFEINPELALQVAGRAAEFEAKMGRKPRFLYLGEQAARTLLGPAVVGINFSRHGADPRAKFRGLEVFIVSDDDHINVG